MVIDLGAYFTSRNLNLGSIISDASEVLVTGSSDLSDKVRGHLQISGNKTTQSSVREFLNRAFGTNKNFAVEMVSLFLDMQSSIDMDKYKPSDYLYRVPLDEQWSDAAKRIYDKFSHKSRSELVEAVEIYLKEASSEIPRRFDNYGDFGRNVLEMVDAKIEEGRRIMDELKHSKPIDFQNVSQLLSIAYNISLISKNKPFYDGDHLVHDLKYTAAVSSATSAFPIGFTIAETIHNALNPDELSFSYIPKIEVPKVKVKKEDGVDGFYVKWRYGDEVNDILILGLTDFTTLDKGAHIGVIEKYHSRLLRDLWLVTDSKGDIQQWRPGMPDEVYRSIKIGRVGDKDSDTFHYGFRDTADFIGFLQRRQEASVCISNEDLVNAFLHAFLFGEYPSVRDGLPWVSPDPRPIAFVLDDNSLLVSYGRKDDFDRGGRIQRDKLLLNREAVIIRDMGLFLEDVIASRTKSSSTHLADLRAYGFAESSDFFFGYGCSVDSLPNGIKQVYLGSNHDRFYLVPRKNLNDLPFMREITPAQIFSRPPALHPPPFHYVLANEVNRTLLRMSGKEIGACFLGPTMGVLKRIKDYAVDVKIAAA